MSSLRLLRQSQQKVRVRNYDEDENYDEEGIVFRTTRSRWRVLLSFGGLLLMAGLGVWGVREVSRLRR